MESPPKVWRKSKTIAKELGQNGLVISFTKIHAAPSGFEHQIPYFVAIIKFKNGQKKTLEVVDVSQTGLKIGTKVTTVLRRINQASPEGVIHYGIKAKTTK